MGGEKVTPHIRTEPPSFKVSLGRGEFEHKTDENLKWRTFNADLLNLEL